MRLGVQVSYFSWPESASVDETVERFGRLSEAGIDDLILGMGNDTDDAVYPLVAEVVRRSGP